MSHSNLFLIALLLSGITLLTLEPAFAATVLFEDDFEMQPAVSVNNTAYPDPVPVSAFPTKSTTDGQWKYWGNSPAECVQVTKYVTPGAYGGENYLRMIQKPGTYDGTGIDITNQYVTGDTIRWEANVLCPTTAGVPFFVQVGPDSVYSMASIGVVGAQIVYGEASAPLSSTYTPGVWQHWQCDYTIGANTFTFALDGQSHSGLAVDQGSLWGIEGIRFEQTGSATGGVCIDNVKVTLNPRDSYLLGDADGDNKVNETDAAFLAAHWLQQENATWEDGDFNEDNKVDDLDAAILAANWGYGVTENASVPEPCIFTLLAFAAIVFLALRRKTSR